jgi:signal transduction histidine kinase
MRPYNPAMHRVSGNSSGLRPPVRWIAAGCALAIVGGAGIGLAWSGVTGTPPSPSALPGSGVALEALTLLVALGAAAVALVIGWRQHGRAAELQAATARLRGLDDMLDVWQWETDGEHRLSLLRPPCGAPAADWSGAKTGQPLWQAFRVADEAALRAQLASHAALDDVEVRRESASSAGHAFRLHGRSHTDAHGGFAGYQGILRELVVPAVAPVPAAAEDRDDLAKPAAVLPVGAKALASDTAAAGSLDSDHESFSFTVSHDLRAPIRVVEGFTKIVKEDYGRLLDRVGNDHLDRVLGAAARMNNMIDALLALSKLSSQPLARQPVNLSQLATYVADDLRRQWPEREVKIAIEPGMLVQGDPTLLRVVVENLLGNAWKYSAKAAQPQIAFERSAGQADGFSVRDNGAGFDMRFADRLFGVFQRLHSANDFPGTGIGLASVRRIVRRHGGEIWGEAEVNRGACFHFSLPQETPRR